MAKPIGSVNAAFLAKLYKGSKIIGHCADTPNAVAYAFNKTGATMAVSKFSKFKKSRSEKERQSKSGFFMLSKSRVKNAGWFNNDKEAYLVRF